MAETPWQIALDGPAASGKSTTAREVARRLGIRYLDTGAMYRALMVALLDGGADWSTEAGVTPWLDPLEIRLEEGPEGQRVLLGGRDVSQRIRENRVSVMMAPVCAMPGVRHRMVALQRELGSRENCVIDGRDIGTVVFPGARFKFFLWAELEERARRRQLELARRGQQARLEDLVEEIRARDEQDSTRSVGPLRRAEDALLLDTTRLGLEEQVEVVVNTVRQALEADR